MSPVFLSTVVKPPDFDQFWQDTLDELSKVPLDPTIEPVPSRSTEQVEVFDVRWSSWQGVRIAGWYARPRSATGKLPGLIHVPGYVSEPLVPKPTAKQGYAALSVAPRGKLRSNDCFNPGYPGLLTHNIVDRNTYGYRGFYCDALRAVDWMLTRPELDTSRIGVTGSSQGGALTVLTAAMRREITCAAAGAPYLAGYMDAARLTHSYPYQEINDYLRLYPERREQVAHTLQFFDISNFADRITCPILINIGEKDDVCPPETGRDLFDRITNASWKKLHAYPDCAHDAGSAVGHAAIVSQFLKEHLKP
jgi:cephalosporin-C deacetylase